MTPGMLRQFWTKHLTSAFWPNQVEEKTGFVHLGPSKKSKLREGGRREEKKCKDFAKLLSRLKDWLSQLLSDQEDRKENSRGCLI